MNINETMKVVNWGLVFVKKNFTVINMKASQRGQIMKIKKEAYSSIVRNNFAQQIMRISKSMENIFLDQLNIIGHYDAQYIFEIDQSKCRVYILNRLFWLDFSAPAKAEILHSKIKINNIYQSEIVTFIYQHLLFYSTNNESQNSILMRETAENFRKLLCNQLYIWVDAEQRVNTWLGNLTPVQVEVLDHLMIKAGIFKGKMLPKQRQSAVKFPAEITHFFVDLFRLDAILGNDFFNLQSLIQSFKELSLSAHQFMPASSYRVMQLYYPHHFNLNDYMESTDKICMLQQHAQQYSNVLNFVKHIPQQHWTRSDLFAKQYFYKNEGHYWNDKIQTPLFNSTQEVNWVFKQETNVVNWIADSVQHTSSRITMTALSFIDCSHFHSNIILATLQHFQFVSARMFILSCAKYAEKEQYSNDFDHLKPSVLYLDEWLTALSVHVQIQPNAVKIVYMNLSRLIQSYMRYLYNISKDLPQELMEYILPETQQGRKFIFLLKRYNITLEDFRHRFYLIKHHVKESVFDSYVRDYLMSYLTDNPQIKKNVSWFGLFEKAISWHYQAQKDEMLKKLKQKYLGSTWQSFTEETVFEFNHWKFEELKNLDQIIAESQYLRHCLAESYTPQIVQGEYVAFHMSSPILLQHLTLGCHVKNNVLLFDQLEYSNNKKAEQVLVSIAKQFIEQLNLGLKIDQIN